MTCHSFLFCVYFRGTERKPGLEPCGMRGPCPLCSSLGQFFVVSVCEEIHFPLLLKVSSCEVRAELRKETLSLCGGAQHTKGKYILLLCGKFSKSRGRPVIHASRRATQTLRARWVSVMPRMLSSHSTVIVTWSWPRGAQVLKPEAS